MDYPLKVSAFGGFSFEGEDFFVEGGRGFRGGSKEEGVRRNVHSLERN